VLQLTTTNLRRIAVALKAVALKAGVDDASNYRRIRRFLKDYDVDYAALSRLVCRLLPQDPPYVLVLDRTEWHFGSVPVNVLMIGIAHQSVAVPLAWQALPKSGSSGAGEQIEVLAAALEAVAPSDVEALVADREFISTQWLRRLQAQDLPFVIRLRSNRRLHISDEGPALPAKMHARSLSVGQSRVLGTRTLCGSESSPVRVQVTVRRIGTDAQPLKDRAPRRPLPGACHLGPGSGARPEPVPAALGGGDAVRGAEVAGLRPRGDAPNEAGSHSAADRALSAGGALEPPHRREARAAARPAAHQKPWAPRPEPLPVRTRPAARDSSLPAAATGRLQRVSTGASSPNCVFVRYLGLRYSVVLTT